MTPAAIIQAVAGEGVALAVSSTGSLRVSGDPGAVNRWAAMLKAHKDEIIHALAANDHEHEQKAEPVLCIACQHYRFGHDHVGNIARCHAAGG